MRAGPMDVQPRSVAVPALASAENIRHSAPPRRGPAAASERGAPSIHVAVLGGFGVMRDGMPLTCRARPATKPLALLTALVLAGGRDVPLRVLAQRLWPAAEAGSAGARLDAALRRLRCLLGVDAAIQVDGDRVSLNPAWVSVDAFELLSHCQCPLADPGHDLVQRLLDGYPGELLPDEDGDPWVIRARERLVVAFAAGVIRLAHWLESVGESERARHLCCEALRREPTAIGIRDRLALLGAGRVASLGAA